MLNSSQQSIQKVVGYALKYFAKCGEDLWDCIVEESQKVHLFSVDLCTSLPFWLTSEVGFD